MAINLEDRLEEAKKSMSEDYLFPLQFFREDILDVSRAKFSDWLNRVGGKCTAYLVMRYEEQQLIPDWRNRVAIQRLWLLAVKIMREKKDRERQKLLNLCVPPGLTDMADPNQKPVVR